MVLPIVNISTALRALHYQNKTPQWMFHLKCPGERQSERLDYKSFSCKYTFRCYDPFFIFLCIIIKHSQFKDHVFFRFVADLYMHIKHVLLKGISLSSSFKLLNFILYVLLVSCMLNIMKSS